MAICSTAQGERKSPVANQRFEGDRRSKRRYEIGLKVRWNLMHRNKLLDCGTGRTVNLSSGGILFETGRNLPVGLKVYLSISWPVLLHNAARLQLRVEGRVVRSESNRIAIQTVQREFRTAGAISEPHRVLAASAGVPITSETWDCRSVVC
jgi:PilZ domain